MYSNSQTAQNRESDNDNGKQYKAYNQTLNLILTLTPILLLNST